MSGNSTIAFKCQQLSQVAVDRRDRTFDGNGPRSQTAAVCIFFGEPHETFTGGCHHFGCQSEYFFHFNPKPSVSMSTND